MILRIIILFAFILFLVKRFYFKNKKKSPSRLLMKSSITAALIILYWFLNGIPRLIINLKWLSWGLQRFSISLTVDFPFIIFSAVGLFVTWSIVEFSEYYMNRDPNKRAFINTLILFLLFMLILVSSNNLFILFIGWEGVGIMSFVLIRWWFTRSDANSSALQAIIYKRIGDRGMILFMIITLVFFNTWKLKEIIFFKRKTFLLKIAIFGIILAAAGKSAQFILHPWLPAAMEGPTPVSALLHRSTMVVAGVFLLFRCSPLFQKAPWSLLLIRLIGSLTALFAARVALTQFDIKKIVAYSTTRQLGLMVVAIGINAPTLALFHICTHAFFKALLFLCSGSIIHKFKKEQDIRKMGNSRACLPLTTRCIIIGRLALCGLPFLAGYYSKDLILEARQYRITKRIRIILALLATLMTSIYSLRLIMFISFPKAKTTSVKPISEEKKKLRNPLIRLTSGVFISGWAISLTFIRHRTLVVPWIKKALPLIMLITVTIVVLNRFKIEWFKNTQVKLKKLSRNGWFYVNIIHSFLFLNIIKYRTSGVLRILDQGWTSFIGVISITNITLFFSNIILKTHKSSISLYFKFLIIFITVSLVIIFFL